MRGRSDEDINPVFPGSQSARGLRVREHQDAHDSQGAAISSMAAKIGCTAETLRRRVRQAAKDYRKRAGLTTDERKRVNGGRETGSGGHLTRRFPLPESAFSRWGGRLRQIYSIDV